MTTSQKKTTTSVYQIVTDKVIKMLGDGIVPWHKPWKGGKALIPSNYASKIPYRGINVFTLFYTAQAKGFTSPYWMTWKQVTEQAKGEIKEDQRKESEIVVFWKILRFKDKDANTGEEKTKTVPMLKYYRVWNTDQCTFPEKYQAKLDAKIKELTDVPTIDHEPIEEAQLVMDNYINSQPGLKINLSTMDKASYRPSTDSIQLPLLEQFDTPEDHYCTAFHEMIHSTGHKNRLNREGIVDGHFFGDEEYSKEELIAEMGAAFLCGITGITNEALINNSATYIANWTRVLKSDEKLLVYAAGAAQKAADFVIEGKAREYSDDNSNDKASN